eukprot:GILK01017645.1.p1 GENE.GILK01017645.1~~GILK01017645.1.p1  ORF type:complete len:115 (+),score=8.16 GILK01017645.1:32-346(+)
MSPRAHREASTFSSITRLLAVGDGERSKVHTLRSYLYLSLVATGIISLWRGLWVLQDILLFPNDPLLSGVISASAGFLILMLTGTFAAALNVPLSEDSDQSSDP